MDLSFRDSGEIHPLGQRYALGTNFSRDRASSPILIRIFIRPIYHCPPKTARAIISGPPQILLESEETAIPTIPGPLRFTARRANLMNGFAGACLKFFFPTHFMGKIFLPSHIWLRFFCRAIKWVGEKNGFSSDFEEIGGNNGSLRASIFDRCPEKTREKNGFSSDFDTFSSSWSFFFQKKDGFSPNSEGVGGNIGRGKNSPFFFQKKGPSPAVENRKRFSTAGAEKKNRRSLRKSHAISERSRICLIARRAKEQIQDFSFPEIGGNNGSFRAPISDRCPEGTSKTRELVGKAKIWTFGTFFYGIFDSGSPQIPKESEGTAVLPLPGPLRFQRNLRGRPFLRFACFFPLPLRGRGNKNLRHAPANPFMRFARRAVNRKERQDFFPSAPQGQRKKTRESERTAKNLTHRSEKKTRSSSPVENRRGPDPGSTLISERE